MKRFLICFFLSLGPPFFLTSCCFYDDVERQSFVMGTLADVIVSGVPSSVANKAINEVFREFDRIHHEFHPWLKPSQLVFFNEQIARGRPVQVSHELLLMLEDMRFYENLTHGFFNPAIGRLIALWGFHSEKFSSYLPQKQNIRFLVSKNPSMNDLSFDEKGYVSSRNRFVSVDDGGYAKGLALDNAVVIMRRYQVDNALINLGGNIVAIGQHKGEPWLIGIRDPRSSRAFAVVALHSGEAVGTSGDYHRYFDYHGTRYCHLIDPFSGYPPQGVESVTVLIPSGLHAGVRSDVLSKPLFFSSSLQWAALAHSLGVNAAARVEKGRYVMTQALFQRAVFVDPKVMRVTAS